MNVTETIFRIINMFKTIYIKFASLQMNGIINISNIIIQGVRY